MNQPYGFDLSFILYKKVQLTNDNLLDSWLNPIFLFGTKKMVLEDLKNIKFLLYYIAGYIKDRHLKNNREENIPSFLGFGQIV